MKNQAWTALAVMMPARAIGFCFRRCAPDKMEGNLNRRMDNLSAGMNNCFNDLKDWI